MNKKLMMSTLALLSISLTACSSNKKIMRADDWKDKFPNEYNSYQRNAEMEETTFGGSVPIDYLKEHPNLLVFYDGYGFSKEYKRARGHVYALDDVINTARPKAGASCLACKTSDFVEALNDGGIGVNGIKFEDFVADNPQMETISCYDCHKNKPGEFEITRSHLTEALKLVDNQFKDGDLACAQCHVEYYMDPDSKEVILPWHNGFDTDGMLDYYDDIGFFDWEHPTTGTKLLKAQHPEFETFQGSIHSEMGLTCIDCHMPEMEDEKGDKYRTHHWTSPLKTMEQSCLKCHTDETEDSLKKKVEDIQRDVTNKTDEVSDILLNLIEELTYAVENKTHSEDVIEQVRDIHRKAQFKWDFVFVENGEGFHNPDKAHKNLDEARELAEEGLRLINKQ